MDWTVFLTPQVIAPTAGLVGVLVGSVISSCTTRSNHRERLVADQALAERKITADIDLAEQKLRFDKELAEHRVQLDTTLAEKKFAFDKGVIAWRRRYELAELILSSAYEVRDALLWARARIILEGEGETRPATASESAQSKEDRNSAFVPIERLTAHAKAFATLQTAQDNAAAHFEPSVFTAIGALLGEHRRIATASSYLIEHADWNEDRSGRDALRSRRDELWGADEPGGARQRIDAAIRQLEEACKPILSTSGPT